MRRFYLMGILGCAAILPFCGCGKSGAKTMPIAGRVTLGGNAWPHAGTLSFHPIEAPPGMPKIPGSADFSPDGSFTATTFKANDGLAPGRYRVTVDCWEKRPLDGQPGKNCYVPEQYRNPKTTPLEIDVSSGAKRADVLFDVLPPMKGKQSHTLHNFRHVASS